MCELAGLLSSVVLEEMYAGVALQSQHVWNVWRRVLEGGANLSARSERLDGSWKSLGPI